MSEAEAGKTWLYGGSGPPVRMTGRVLHGAPEYEWATAEYVNALEAQLATARAALERIAAIPDGWPKDSIFWNGWTHEIKDVAEAALAGMKDGAGPAV